MEDNTVSQSGAQHSNTHSTSISMKFNFDLKGKSQDVYTPNSIQATTDSTFLQNLVIISFPGNHSTSDLKLM